jgi:precorrin-6B methylase 2
MSKKVIILLFASLSLITIYANPSQISLGKNEITPSPYSKEAMEKLYEGLSGFGVAQNEYEIIRQQGGNPTYGEITYESTAKLLNILKITKDDVLYDLGSGVGKFIMQAYHNTPVKKAVGIELSSTRIQKANEAIARLQKQKKLKKDKIIQFREENFANTDISDATVIYLCSTCFSEELMKIIIDKMKSCKNGLRVATLKTLPPDPSYRYIATYTLPMTWSSGSSVHIYKLVSPESVEKKIAKDITGFLKKEF